MHFLLYPVREYFFIANSKDTGPMFIGAAIEPLFCFLKWFLVTEWENAQNQIFVL